MFPSWQENLSEAQAAQISAWAKRITTAALVLLFILSGTLALAFDTLVSTGDSVSFEVGEVATRDILAPRSLTYNSQILTEQARRDAIERVEAVYDPNPDVTRTQIRKAGNVKAYITQVKHDPYASEEQLISDLRAIEGITINNDIWEAVLTLSDSRWELIGNEITALVERTMQSDIREDNLDVIRNNLPNSVASRFSDSEAEIIIAIAEDLIQPNTFYNREATLQRQDEAAAQINEQERRFEEGELIVRSNTLVSELQMEALRQFGMLEPPNVRIQTLLGSLLVMCLTTLILWLYIDGFHQEVSRNPRLLILIGTLFILFLLSIHIFGEAGANQPYLYPAAALALLLTSLAGVELAIISISVLAILVGITQSSDRSLELAALIVVGSVAGILSLRRGERINSYFVAGLLIGLANLIVMLGFALHNDDQLTFSALFTRSIVSASSGLFAAGIALVLLYVITSLMNLTTSLKLIELMDSKQLLLQRLLREAPGTYQHSLQVGNLGELAAEAIGANAPLVRVAAMYHDIGKMLNPYYFSENTAGTMNPHEDLNDPYQSARVIIGHVIEGERLARRYNLPARIRDFILEHHGTTQVLYFYDQALERVNDQSQVKIEDFTYPGPAPRSRETAIMMLADGCESATRSRNPSSKSDIEEMVNTIFELRLSEGQLDNSGLTLNDLKTIRNIFIETLQAMYHPRIAYKIATKRLGEEKPRLTNGIVKALDSGGEVEIPADVVEVKLPEKLEAEAASGSDVLVTVPEIDPLKKQDSPIDAAVAMSITQPEQKDKPPKEEPTKPEPKDQEGKTENG